MKIEVNSTYLAETLKPISSRDYRSESIWLNATADCLEAAINAKGDVIVSVAIQCKEHPALQYVCQEPGSGAVKSRVFQEQLHSIQNRTILIEFSETPRVAILPESGEEQLLVMQPFETIDQSVILQKPDSIFIVEREILLNCLKAVRYAMGKEPTKPYYQGIAVKIDKSKIRCIGGTGSFFTGRTMHSKSLAEIESVIEVFLPASSIAAVIAWLESVSDDCITFKVFSKSKRYVIESSKLQLLIGYADAVKYVNVDKVLKFNYSNHFRVNMDKFKYAVAGVVAAYKQIKQAGSDIVCVDMVVDLQVEQIVLMLNAETVSIVPMTQNFFSCEINSLISLKYKITHLELISKHFRDAKELVVRFHDSSMPIVVDPVSRTGKAASSGSQDFIFFATSKLK